MSNAEVLQLIVFTLGWAGGRVPVYVDGELATTIGHTGELVNDADSLLRRAVRWDFERNAEVALGLPPAREGTTVLWAWVAGKDQLRRARRFSPLPSIALRVGGSSRRLLLWGLNERVDRHLAEHSNRKLAYALHARQKDADGDALRVPLPGTFLRIGRKKPAPILVTRAIFSCVSRERVVGRLKDPPAPFMQRLREGRVSR